MSRNNIDDSSGLMDTWKDFTNKCTIVGLSQVTNRRSLTLRVMWALIAVAGLGIAVWQTSGVITEYFEHKVIMKSEWRSEGLQLLPTITICAFKASAMDAYKAETALDKYDKELISRPEKFQLENKSNKYLDSFQAAVDWNGGLYVIDSTLQDHGFNQETTDGWNRLHLAFERDPFGRKQCFTFNSAINSSQWIRSPPYTGVTFYMARNDSSPYYTNSNTAVVMHISTPGVAPTCESGDGSAITLKMGNHYIASIEWEEVTRIPNRGSSRDCVSSEGNHQPKSVYYTEKRQYKYSIEACTKTMMQNISLHFCDCYIPTIPVGYLSDHYPDARPCMTTCAHVLNMTNIFDKCGVPCWEMSFRRTIQTTPLLFYQNELINELRGLPEDFQNPSEGHHSPPINKNLTDGLTPDEPTNCEPSPSYFTSERLHSKSFVETKCVVVKVQVQSPLMSVFYETPKYSLSDFWGVMGGNLGLWVGVTAVSIGELVELLLIICSQLYKKFTRSDEVSPQKSKQLAAHVIEVSENSK